MYEQFNLSQQILIRIFVIINIMNNMEQKKEQLQCPSRKDMQTATSSNQIPTASSFMSNKFFEVTINSQKLSELFTNINEYMYEQDKKIDKIYRDIQSMNSALQNKLQSQSRKSGLLFTKLDLKISESSNTYQCYLTDVHKKSQQRDLELSNRIQSLRSKIGKVEDGFKQDLKNGLVCLKKQIIGQGTAQDSNIVEYKNDPIRDEKVKPDFNSIIEHFTVQLQKVGGSICPLFNQFYQQKQAQKKKQHAQDMLNLASKKQQIQSSSLKQQRDLGNMRVIYPSGRKNGAGNKQNEQTQSSISKTLNNRIRHMSYTKMSGIQEEIIENYRQMGDKVYMLDNMMAQHSQIVADLKNKMIVLDEKAMILTRKLQKNSQQTAQIKNTIRRVQNQKLDDKSIDQLRNYVKWNLRDMEQKIVKKCSDQDLQKQKMRVTQKLSIIHENLIQKAQKGEIQKALMFLENKIKQIIFLIAAEQSQERQGAIMKVAAKCLSCDKQVERQLQMQSSNCKRQMNKQSQGQYIKSMTHRVRQKYKKQIAKTLGNETFDD